MQPIDIQDLLQGLSFTVYVALSAAGGSYVHEKRRLARMRLGSPFEKLLRCGEVSVVERAHAPRVQRTRILRSYGKRLLDQAKLLPKLPTRSRIRRCNQVRLNFDRVVRHPRRLIRGAAGFKARAQTADAADPVA